MPASRRAQQGAGARLVGGDARRSTASWPCTLSISACRFVPAPEASTPTRNGSPDGHAVGRLELGIHPARRAQAPGRDELVDARHDLRRGQVIERAVGGQAVVAALDERLRAPAAQDLDGPRAADGRIGRLDDLDDRGVEVARRDLRRAVGGAALAGGSRRPARPVPSEASQTSQHGTPGSGAGVLVSPKWRRIVVRRQADPSTNAQTERYWRQRARCPSPADVRQAARARASNGASMRPRTRSGADGAGRTTPARARWPMTARTLSSLSRAVAVEHRRELVGAEVVAAVRSAHLQAPRDGRDRLVGQLAALDEEDVQALVATLGEQQRARRRAVAAGAPGLLVVGLDRARHALVADRAHVRLVDPHAEGVRRDDDLEAAVHEPALDLGALLAAEPGVVDADGAVEVARQVASRASRRRCACPRRRSPASRRVARARPRYGDAWPASRRTG